MLIGVFGGVGLNPPLPFCWSCPVPPPTRVSHPSSPWLLCYYCGAVLLIFVPLSLSSLSFSLPISLSLSLFLSLSLSLAVLGGVLRKRGVESFGVEEELIEIDVRVLS